MRQPTIEYKIKDQNRIVTEFRYTKLVCSDTVCRYSDNATLDLFLNPIKEENLICKRCGSKLIWNGENDFIERFERQLHPTL